MDTQEANCCRLCGRSSYRAGYSTGQTAGLCVLCVGNVTKHPGVSKPERKRKGAVV